MGVDVEDEDGVAVFRRAVEDHHRRLGEEGLLFGEGDFGAGLAAADDRLRAERFRLGGERVLQLRDRADRQALGVDAGVLVELELEEVEGRQVGAVGGADRAAGAEGDRAPAPFSAACAA